MAFAPGRFVRCAAPDCTSTDLTTVDETYDAQDHVFVGQQTCDRCGASMLYSRRASTPEEKAMAKKKKTTRTRTATPTGRAKRRTVTHRLNTIKPNGGLPQSQEVAPEAVPIGEAVRRAIEQLGDVQIDPELAPKQMRELAECYENVAREQAAYDAKAEAAKVAKKSLESATNLILERIRAFTHPAPLPLFDAAEREADQEDMLHA